MLCVEQGIDASEVATLRTRLWEEATATKEAQVHLPGRPLMNFPCNCVTVLCLRIHRHNLQLHSC